VADLTRVLARFRVPSGFVFGALALWLSSPTGRTLLAGGAIALIGESLRFWAAGHLNKSVEVTTSGPYRLMGHPLYVGSSIMGVGLAVASATFAVALLVAVYLGLAITAAIRSEEAFLKRSFGDDYDRYRRGQASENAARAFSFARAIANGEHRALTGLLTAALLLTIKATYNGSFWQAAGGRFIRPGG
jgi:hypothetical protein